MYFKNKIRNIIQPIMNNKINTRKHKINDHIHYHKEKVHEADKLEVKKERLL